MNIFTDTVPGPPQTLAAGDLDGLQSALGLG